MVTSDRAVVCKCPSDTANNTLFAATTLLTQVTSNSFIAKAYAKIIIGMMRDSFEPAAWAVGQRAPTAATTGHSAPAL